METKNNKSSLSRLQLSEKTIQCRFPFETDFFINELKQLKKENTKQKNQFYTAGIQIQRIIRALIELLSKNGRAPSLKEFRKATGMDMKDIYRIYPHIHRYKVISKGLNLRVGRIRKKKQST